MNIARRCGVAIEFGLGLLLICGNGADAQRKTSETITAAQDSLTVGNKRYDAEKELVRLTKRYGLTEEQKAKIQPILMEQQKQVHALGEDEALSNSEWAAELKKVHERTVAQVKQQLTDAQASKYAKDEARPIKSGNGDGDDFGPPDGMPLGGPPPGGGPPF